MTELAPVSIANGQSAADEDDSVLRSGGQTYEFPPGPRIATARPRGAEERRTSEQSHPPEQSEPPERSSS
jgi:hypothetical protein